MDMADSQQDRSPSHDTDPDDHQQQPPASHGLLHGDALVEAGGSDEDGEFSASDLDAGSLSDRSSDLGTGTGLWAIEVGDKFPSAQVLGLDLSPIQPVWVPSNVKFLVDDFDFVHLRNMVPILECPVNLLRQAFEYVPSQPQPTHHHHSSSPQADMKPGAWVELQDVDGQCHSDDGSMPADWPIQRFAAILVQAFAQFGTDAQAEMELFFAECRQAMRDPAVHAYGKMHFWSRQKPLEDE
ncbi:hypothetical protein QQZ08_011826 [Neonectria magnoliae]|uniref:Methyltransferase domain-containing protein n=1 Tax=Neonectria magnoliae TaxID=2732573 RepID=A0ABR1H7B3_9HYPO